MAKSFAKLAGQAFLMSLPFLYPAHIHISVEIMSNFSSPLTKNEAVQLIVNQKKKLGIEEKVNLHVLDDNSIKGALAFCGKEPSNGEFYIVTEEENLKSLILKHEMYHLFKDSKFLDKHRAPYKEALEELNGISKKRNTSAMREKNKGAFKENFYTQFIREPRANIYALMGVKF